MKKNAGNTKEIQVQISREELELMNKLKDNDKHI